MKKYFILLLTFSLLACANQAEHPRDCKLVKTKARLTKIESLVASDNLNDDYMLPYRVRYVIKSPEEACGKGSIEAVEYFHAPVLGEKDEKFKEYTFEWSRDFSSYVVLKYVVSP